MRSLTLFVTHYPSLAELEAIFPEQVTNNHMAFMTSQEEQERQSNPTAGGEAATQFTEGGEAGTTQSTERGEAGTTQSTERGEAGNTQSAERGEGGTTHFSEEGEASTVPCVTFLYHLVNGAAARSYGLNVARLAGIPSEILCMAAEKSHELENVILSRR